jgi:phosphohistidine swiveling domain-containing protein
MRQDGRHRSRLSAPTTWIAALAGGAIAAAIALAMVPAQAEASSTTATLTLTGLVDSNCDVSAGGSTAHVAPGGTVTVKASLAGLSVNVPGIGQVSIDSSKVASFVDTVTIDGNKHTLKKTSDTIVLKNVTGTHKIHWSADKIVVAGGLLGNAITVPLNGNDVNLPAGGKLSWSGQIVASKGTDCGVQIQTPKVKVSAPGATVTLPGVKTSLPNPVHSITKGLPKPSLPGGASSSAPGGKKKSSGAAPTVSYSPPSLTVPQKVMSKASQQGGTGGGGGGGFVPPNSGGGGGGGAPAAASVTRTVAPKPLPSPAAKIKSGKSHPVAQPAHLGGAQLPVLLAILAILALSSVTATYARTYLLRRHN